MSTPTRIDLESPPVTGAVLAWFAQDCAPHVAQDLLGWLREVGNVPPTCAEAFAGYVSALACVEQEAVHPDGRVERTAPMRPELSRDDFEHPRFAYIVASWYEDLTARLQGAQGDWDGWLSRGFRRVQCDEETGDILFWTVRDLSGKPRSTWSVRVDSEAPGAWCMTFVLPNTYSVTDENGPRPSGSGPYETLTRAYLAFRRRIGRVLALLKHLDRLGVESTEEYRHWCQSQRISPKLGKSARQRVPSSMRLRRRGGGRRPGRLVRPGGQPPA